MSDWPCCNAFVGCDESSQLGLGSSRAVIPDFFLHSPINNMIDGKFFATLLGLVIAITAVASFKVKSDEKRKEQFLGNLPSFTWKVDRVRAANPAAARKGDFFSVPGTYQSMLAPRAAPVNYGANINYNLPAYAHQGIPRNPLTFGNIAEGQMNKPSVESFAKSATGRANFTQRHNSGLKEGYCACESCSGCSGVPRCGTGAVPEYSYKPGAPVAEAGYADGNYNAQLDSVYAKDSATEVTSFLPVNDMTTLSGDMEQAPVVYDRLVYANRNSRLRGQGDPIRGDLPITPCPTGWFRPSVQPNVDLQQGALNAIAGVSNQTSNDLAKLIYITSGGTETAIGGTNMAGEFENVNQSNLYISGLSANQSDISVSAFV